MTKKSKKLNFIPPPYKYPTCFELKSLLYQFISTLLPSPLHNVFIQLKRNG
jgi:hypothetical protein